MRFDFERNKISVPIEFGTQLDMSPYFVEPDQRDLLYDLYAGKQNACMVFVCVRMEQEVRHVFFDAFADRSLTRVYSCGAPWAHS